MGIWRKIKGLFLKGREKRREPFNEPVQKDKENLAKEEKNLINSQESYILALLQDKEIFEPEKVIQQLKVLLKKGEEAKTIQYLYLILNKHPNNAELLFFLCNLLIERGDFEAALPILNRLIPLNYKREFVEYWLGLAYEERGELNKALSHYEISLSRNINYTPAKIRYERLKAVLNQLDEKKRKESVIAISSKREGESRYKVVEEIGGGGTGRVYKVEDKLLNRTVAMKIYHSTTTKKQFLKEATTPSFIPHPGIVKILDIEPHKNTIYMKYYEGGSLKEKLKKEWSEEELLKFLIKICEPLLLLEREKLIHRDLKPENIVFDGDGMPIIIDFGLSLRYGEEKREEVLSGGTEKYMPPEYKEKRELNLKYDQYSLGVIIKEIVALSKITSPVINEIINWCLNIEPQFRPSFKELRNYCETSLLKIKYLGL